MMVSAISSTTDSTAFLTSSRVTGSVAIGGLPLAGLPLAGFHRQARVGAPLRQRAIVDGHVVGAQERQREGAGARCDAGPAVGDDPLAVFQCADLLELA